MRKFILAIILMLGVVFILGRFAEVQQLGATLGRGIWYYIVLAVAVETAWVVNNGAAYRAIYRILDLPEQPLLHMAQLAASANFVNIIAPTGGMSGIAVFVADARRQNQPSARMMVAGAMFVLFDYMAFLCVLTLGMAVLARRNNLNWAEITASFILLTGALALLAVIYLGMRSEALLARVLVGATRLINQLAHPFLRHDYIPENRARTFAHDAVTGLSALRHATRRQILQPFFHALLNKTLLILTFFLMFMAFQVPLSAGTLIAGFSVGYLFLIVSPTPSGIGVVEGVLTLSLTSMFVSLANATVVVVAYRGITFWLPLLAGLITFRLLGRLEQHSPQKNLPPPSPTS